VRTAPITAGDDWASAVRSTARAGPDLVSVYSQLLRLPGVRRQIVAAGVSRMTQPLLTLPLLVATDEIYDDHSLAALVVGLYTASFAAMMPVTGRLVDRHGGRVILRIWPGLAMAALLGTSTALTLRAPVPVVVVSVIALGACLPPVGAVTRAGWPILVPPAQLRAAYALDSVINERATISGPLLAALALATMPAPTALLIASLAIVAGSIGLPARVLAPAPHLSERRPDVPRSRRLLLTYGITLCASIGVGSIVATAGLLASDADTPELAGVLLAAVALGAVVAGAAAGRRDVSSDVLAQRLVGYSQPSRDYSWSSLLNSPLSVVPAVMCSGWLASAAST